MCGITGIGSTEAEGRKEERKEGRKIMVRMAVLLTSLMNCKILRPIRAVSI